MDILSCLTLAVDRIESNICNRIDVRDIARECALGEYELSNLFHSLTGMTIKEYVRKRRLTLAGYDLQESDDKIIDVAVKYGYDSADSFRRAFVSQHGVTPSAARKNKSALNIYPSLSFNIEVKGAKKMNFKIIEMKDLEVYGLSVPCLSDSENRYELAREVWSDEYRHLPSKICDGYNGIWYAIWDTNSYTIARDKSNCSKPGLKKTVIPGGKYAVFTTERGGYAGNELPELHRRIYDSFLPNSKYTVNGDIEIEVYHLATDRTTRHRERYYEIWVPVTE